MSQLEPDSEESTQFRAILANITIPSQGVPTLPFLAELANRAFMLANQQAGYDPNNLPLWVKNIQARILYHIPDGDVTPSPVKVVLLHDLPEMAIGIEEVVVDFQKMSVECKDRPNFPIKAEEIKITEEEVKAFLRKLLASAWRDFIKRLNHNGLFPDRVHIEIYCLDKPCPLCGKRTTLCTSCQAFMCRNTHCPASRLLPFQSCFRHEHVSVCLPCLQNAQFVPSLGQCPDCDIWFCRDELAWCQGRPKDMSYRYRSPMNGFRGLSDSDRAHAAKPMLCSDCIEGRGGRADGCANDCCWSSEGEVKSSIICESCSPEGGLSCACGWCWVCDDCKKEELMAPSLRDCPRCKRVYCCDDCSYLHICCECDLTLLCDDCAEEDWCSFAPGPLAGTMTKPESEEGLEPVDGCHTKGCRAKFCGVCVERRKCEGCEWAFCTPCMKLKLCDSCYDSQIRT